VRQPAQPLDAASAHFGWLMPQMVFDSVTDQRASIRLEIVQVLNSLRGEDDVVSHSGYILARSEAIDKRF
jgi:hypothetical protein